MADAIDRMRMGVAATGCSTRTMLAAGLVLFAASLSACGTVSEDTAARMAFAPGRFEIYTCKDIAERSTVVQRRQTELEQLIARAEQGVGGAFVSAIAYRSEYAQTRGELAELNKAATEKQCAISNKYSSGRAIF